MAFPKKIIIAEQAPRDGWQNWKTQIPAETKVKYIKKMIDCGTQRMEVTSYVSPKWVPQLADSDIITKESLEYVKDKPGVMLTALTLNSKGVERAISLGMKNVCFVISASNAHNMRNSNKPTLDCIADFENMVNMYSDKGLNIQLAIACAFGSPFNEEIVPEEVVKICQVALSHGITSIGLGDSAGMSTPLNTRRMLEAILPHTGADAISIHLHDTRGMALANCFVSMELGVSNFDASLGGMGGCPYIPGAKGNVATEDVVYMAENMGISTGYDLDKLIDLSLEMTDELGAPLVASQASIRRNKCLAEAEKAAKAAKE
jgi:hydroxymethylglutaryl-CoA lyase